jgi:hypothetical protein
MGPILIVLLPSLVFHLFYVETHLKALIS